MLIKFKHIDHKQSETDETDDKKVNKITWNELALKYLKGTAEHMELTGISGKYNEIFEYTIMSAKWIRIHSFECMPNNKSFTDPQISHQIMQWLELISWVSNPKMGNLRSDPRECLSLHV